jgi:hypothetical protein
MRRGIALWLAGLGFAVLASSADAAYHLMKVREVHSGGGTGDYVELQMYAGGQNFVSGHVIQTYDNGGNVLSTFTFPANVANGDNQRTILVADGGTIGATPDFVDASLNVAAGGGSVCFIDTLPSNGIDCISYGVTAPPSANPSPVGTPAPALGAGQSLERSIARGCPTLLEPADDTNNSVSDLALASPSPRNNATAPTETACGGGGGGDTDPPQTTITKAPPKKTEKEKAKLKFTSSEPGSTFECKLDKGRYKRCASPRKLKNLDDGKHKFRVRAVDSAGNADPTPDKAKWKVTD